MLFIILTLKLWLEYIKEMGFISLSFGGFTKIPLTSSFKDTVTEDLFPISCKIILFMFFIISLQCGKRRKVRVVANAI